MQSDNVTTSSYATLPFTSFRDSGVGEDYSLVTERLAIKIVTGILAVAGLYITASQVTFWIFANIVRKEVSRNHNHAASLNLLCALASIMSVLRIGIPIDDIIGYDSTTKCVIVIEYRIITYGLAFANLYTILWVRQRAFYSSPALLDLSTPFVRCLSMITPFIIWPGCVVTIILVNFSEEYYATEFGCGIRRKPLNEFAWWFRAVAFFLMQCNLLALFIYPLLRHRKTMKNTIQRNTDSLDILMKRASVTTIVCIGMDTTSTLFGVFYVRDLALFHHFVYDINILVNLVAVIFSFNNWRKRLFPWRTRKLGKSDMSEQVSHKDPKSTTSVV